MECSITKCTFWNKTKPKISSSKLKIDFFCTETSAHLHLMKGNWGSVLFPAETPLLWRNYLKKGEVSLSDLLILYFFFPWKCRQGGFGEEWNNRKANSILVWIPHERRLAFLISHIHLSHPSSILWTFFDAQTLPRAGFWPHHSTFYPLYCWMIANFPCSASVGHALGGKLMNFPLNP